MKKKPILKVFLLSTFLMLYNCFSIAEIHYLPPPDNEKNTGKSRLMMQLYDDEQYDLVIIKTDKNEVLYQNSKINQSINTKKIGGSKVLEFSLKENVKYVILKYNEKKYKLEIDRRFNIMFLDIRLNKVEVGYTNRDPVFTDY